MIESLVLQALTASTMAGQLALYQGAPAVFYAQAPNDMDEGWAGSQFPRCVYAIDWAYDPERLRVGGLAVDLFCLNDGPVAPEELARPLEQELNERFLTSEGMTYSLIWRSTDQFFTGDALEPQALGATVCFDIMAYPVHAEQEPDPAWGLMRYLKAREPQLLVIGLDPLPELFQPGADSPVCYVRASGESATVRPTYACTWLRATLVVHLHASGAAARRALVKRLSEALTLYGELPLSDGSPLLIKQVSHTASANPLTVGQLTVTGEYGVLRRETETAPIQVAHMKWRNEHDQETARGSDRALQ